MSDTATWIYVVLVFIIFLIGVGIIWGRLWNKEWSLGGHPGSLVLILIFGLLAAYAVFNLRTTSQMEGWFKSQRSTLARSIADSGRFNRSVLTATWNQLAPAGGQQELTPPDQAGNELRLNTPEEAFTLSLTAAEETRGALRSKPPFILGIPLATKSPKDIATETVDLISFDASRFPTIVPAANEWTSTAATIQTNHALDTAHATLKPGLTDLRTACFWLLIASIGIPLITIPIAALNDIKINPTPKR